MNISNANGSGSGGHHQKRHPWSDQTREISNRRAYVRFLQLLLMEAIQQRDIHEACQIAAILLESPAASLDAVWKPAYYLVQTLSSSRLSTSQFLLRLRAASLKEGESLLREIAYFDVHHNRMEEAINSLYNYINTSALSSEITVRGYLAILRLAVREARLAQHTGGISGGSADGPTQDAGIGLKTDDSDDDVAYEDELLLTPNSRDPSSRIEELMAVQKELERVITQDPSNHYFVFYYLEATMALELRDEVDRATKTLEELLNVSPNDPALLQMVIRLLERQGRSYEPKWVECIKALLRVDPCASVGLYLKPWVRYINENDTDVASCGVVTLEILAGRIEVGGDADYLYVWKVLADVLSTIRDLEPGLDDRVWKHRKTWWPRYMFNRVPNPRKATELDVYKAICARYIYGHAHTTIRLCMILDSDDLNDELADTASQYANWNVDVS
ncbi:hypothetical protein EV182_000922 [Spiromyces aspiralis]|uniref:Uncharacterized protein n=1 Tax=Spiromyces aspiralis TaxID=68401 RepID=A0ACC1HZW8_9FUNG|nr:hypothetical protein EV182_000922 [Spiromyces aspiralis]